MTATRKKSKIVILTDVQVDPARKNYHTHVYSCGHIALVGPYAETNQSYHVANSRERIGEKYRCYACAQEA